MKVSATEEHGVRCLMRLAIAWQAGVTTTLPEVARCENMSPQYAAKLAATLRRAGLVRSVRGVRGGVGLARAPETITLTEALAALSGTPVRTGPCMGPDGTDCSHQGHCGLRGVWTRVATVVTGVLDEVTLADLVAGGRPVPEAGPTAARWPSSPR